MADVGPRVIDKRYLNIPLLKDKNAPQHRMRIAIDNELLGEFDVPLAHDREDFFGFRLSRNFSGTSYVYFPISILTIFTKPCSHRNLSERLKLLILVIQDFSMSVVWRGQHLPVSLFAWL